MAFTDATPVEIDKIMQQAWDAFHQYRKFSLKQRAAFMHAIAAELEATGDALIQTAMQETNLPEARLRGERARTIFQLNSYADACERGEWLEARIDTAIPDKTPPKPDIRKMLVPLGPVVVFGASNFPFAFSVAGGDTVSALAAGCPVVYKAHPAHPATSEMVGAIIVGIAKEHNMPEGIFSLLQTAANETSIYLVTHPLIKAVAFTGSFTGGRALYDAAAKRTEPIPVYAEMGSTNPVFVLPGIMQNDGDALAEKLAASNMLSAGQFCTNPGIIISLQSPYTDNFLSRFSARIKNAVAETMLTENIYSNYHKGIGKLMVAEGVKLKAFSKGNEIARTAAPYMFETTAKTFMENNVLSQEVFGPASIHVIAATEEELYAIAKALPAQLTASVWGTEKDMDTYANLMNELELKAGRIIFNNVPTGVEVTHAMVHGGPYPATTDSRTTSVGTTAIYRFTRPVCYQNFPENLLPDALKNDNPLKIQRLVNSNITTGNIW